MHNKGNYNQNKKITYGLGKNICKWWDSQEVNFQNIQTVYTNHVDTQIISIFIYVSLIMSNAEYLHVPIGHLYVLGEIPV